MTQQTGVVWNNSLGFYGTIQICYIKHYISFVGNHTLVFYGGKNTDIILNKTLAVYGISLVFYGTSCQFCIELYTSVTGYNTLVFYGTTTRCHVEQDTMNDTSVVCNNTGV